MSAPEKILVRGVNWLGDAIMTTPALQRLREAKPHARITILMPEKLAGLFEGQPFIDAVTPFSESDGALQIGRRLRQEQFSVGIAFPNSFRSALELWLARIPRRIGRARNGRGILLTHALGTRPGAVRMRKKTDGEIKRAWRIAGCGLRLTQAAHHVHDYLQLVGALEASTEVVPPRIVVSERTLHGVEERFGLAGKTWFGLGAGAEYGPAKRWPQERFVAAAAELHRRTGHGWLMVGGPNEALMAARLTSQIEARAAGVSIVNLCGKTSLAELAAALKVCRLVVANDTGPMHLASAVGTPVVALFGSTSPELTGPLLAANAQILRSNVPCTPCFRRECPIDFRCMTAIPPEAVVEAGLRLQVK